MGRLGRLCFGGTKRQAYSPGQSTSTRQEKDNERHKTQGRLSSARPNGKRKHSKSFQVPATAGDGLKSPLMGMLEKCGSLDFRNERILYDSRFFLLGKIQPVKIDVKAAFHQFRSVYHGLGGPSSLNYTDEQNCQSRRGLKVRWSLQDDKPATHQDIDPR